MLTIEPAPDIPRDQRDTLLIMFNGSDEERSFRVPKLSKRRRTTWKVVLDSSRADGKSDVMITGGRDVLVPGCSILVAAAQ